MKTGLIILAKEKGFSSERCLVSSKELFDTMVAKNDYLWMCLLQKWLRDEHGIYAEAELDKRVNPGIYWRIKGQEIKSIYSDRHYETYEQALEEALTKALELI